MLITKFIEIDLGHCVTNHKSKCRNLHGHRYKIVVGVDDKVVTTVGASDEGMVIDFSDLKEAMMGEIDFVFDHGFAIWEQDPRVEFFKQQFVDGYKVIILPFIPTAENLAKHWFKVMDSELQLRKINLEFIEVYETPTSTARYTRSDYAKDTSG